MDIQLLAAHKVADAQQWADCWATLPAERRDVYFHPAYALANEVDGRGEALCYVAKRGPALLLYPFLRGPVPESAALGIEAPISDIQTPYGYGGPVVNDAGEEEGFLNASWAAFGDWCRQSDIIAEFIRFHPLLRNERWASASTRILFNRRTVFLDLQSYPADFHAKSCFQNHRQTVHRAIRAGATTEKVPADQGLAWFGPKYAETQNALGAGAETRFSPAYFASLARDLGAKVSLWSARHTSGAMARAILELESDVFSHGHLMAFGEASALAGASNLLLHRIALDAAERGLRMMHIGGGRARGDEDALFKFKSRVAPGRAEFRIGTCCHQPERFEQLRRGWVAQRGPAPTDRFLFYRASAQGRTNAGKEQSKLQDTGDSRAEARLAGP
ncbi:MAG: GNAT family N-acetyltransferase [Verrucomicrobia bacterium]|nr:GNAT family N-acetyltransferase [Verrucomicrobiota bacterium]